MNGRKILSVDKWQRGEVVWLPCCWDDCQRSGTTLHRTRYHSHARGIPCDHPTLGKHVWYVFCSERHRQLFLASHRSGYGRLPVGERGRVA